MRIGVDIGGTFIKAGIVDDGKILRKFSFPTESHRGQRTVINNILKCIRELYGNGITSIGIGSAGSIEHKTGTLISCANLPLRHVTFPEIIKKEFPIPVFVGNDADCFAWGEFLYGAGKGSRTMIGITLGTGIGSGVVLNGKIHTGRDMAAELGHTIIDFNGEKCNCGKKGHLEAYIGTKGIQKRFGRNVSPEEIFNLAMKGNKKAKKTWEETGKYLGIGIVNFIHSYDPDVVVIGGNVAKAWKFFSKSMLETVRKQSLMPKTPIVRAKLEDAGVIGAAELID